MGNNDFTVGYLANAIVPPGCAALRRAQGHFSGMLPWRHSLTPVVRHKWVDPGLRSPYRIEDLTLSDCQGKRQERTMEPFQGEGH